MKKIIFLFYIVFQVSLYQVSSKELDKETLYKVQDKLLSCILETAKIQREYQVSGFNLVNLESIISDIEKIYNNPEYYFDMNVLKVNGFYKVKLYLNNYYEFIFDKKIIQGYKKFNQTLEYNDIFESYYRFLVHSVHYNSKIFTFTSDLRNPIIAYVKIEDGEAIVLRPSELDPNYVEKDKTNSFFINETCR